jgi:predicted transcriptional regulator of viral defense system
LKAEISEQMEMLLWKAVEDRNGVVSIRMAEQLYSTKSSAKSAIQKLELLDYIERTSPGHWKVIKLPSDIKRQLKQKMEA